MATKNFDGPATYTNGEPVKVGIEGVPVEATFKQLIVMALSTRYEEDARATPTDLYKRGKLADKIDAGGDVEISSDESVLIKNFAAKAWPPRTIALIHDRIEADHRPASADPKEP